MKMEKGTILKAMAYAMKARGVPEGPGQAPGPPPRPGLEWNPQSHRWIRTETGPEGYQRKKKEAAQDYALSEWNREHNDALKTLEHEFKRENKFPFHIQRLRDKLQPLNWNQKEKMAEWWEANKDKLDAARKEYGKKHDFPATDRAPDMIPEYWYHLDHPAREKADAWAREKDRKSRQALKDKGLLEAVYGPGH